MLLTRCQWVFAKLRYVLSGTDNKIISHFSDLQQNNIMAQFKPAFI